MGLFDTDRQVAEAFPPGEFIKDELDARGWSQSDLADILGRNTGTVSQLISGKQPINPTLAKELGAAFSTTAQFWMNLQTSYSLWKEAHAETDAVERKARLYAIAPVKELIKRHWIEPSENIDVLEKRVCAFLGIDDPTQTPTVSYAARRSGSYAEMPSNSMVAWLKRATYLAEAAPAAKFTDKLIVDGQHRLRCLMQTLEDVKQVPKVLSGMGIKFVVVEHMPQTKLDGATFWLKETVPVIALTLRHDRLDNFWQTLLHEIDHVRQGEGKKFPILDEDIESGDKPENEKRCDEFAATFSIPRHELEDWIARHKPYFTPDKASGFALRMKVHPAVAAGQIRHRLGNFSVLSTLANTKVRPYIFETAIADGWGRTVVA